MNFLGERLPYSNVYVSELEIGSSANENGYFTLEELIPCDL